MTATRLAMALVGVIAVHPEDTSMPTVSVIVPTYRRSATLLQALGSLQKQRLERFEVLVVDNAADAAVERAVAEFNRSARVPARYVPEPQLGLHHARHAGARASRGDLLVFTDDDATFDEGWLQAYTEAFSAHPEMAAAGGPVRPVWEVPPPQWLMDYMGTAPTFGILSLMRPQKGFRLAPDEIFFGVNMVIRRNILFRVGGFNPELIGTRTIGDGESGLVEKLKAEGALIGHVPDAVVCHHIAASRMSVRYIRRWASHLGGSVMYRRWHCRKRTAKSIAADVVRVLREQGSAMVRDVFVRRRMDREAITIQFQASLGWSMLRYVWWVISDPVVKNALDAKVSEG